MTIQFKRLFFVLSLTGTIIAGGCKKDYTTGGSLSKAITPLNNMDYLSANQYHEFDTTVQIINKLGLAAEVNSAKTFFAFTDFSVLLYMNLKLTAKQNINPSAAYTIDSLVKDISADSVRQYMFGETIELSSAPLFATGATVPSITSLANTPMVAFRQLQTGAPYTTMTAAPTYLLYLGKPGAAVNTTSVLCQTTGIKTSNGNTTLHVLANGHTFSRF